MDDIKNIAVKVESKEQKLEVGKWFEQQGAVWHGCNDYEDSFPFVASNYENNKAYGWCEGDLINSKTILSYTDWKSRFAGSDEKEEWVMFPFWTGDLVTPNKWYQITKQDGNRVWFKHNEGEEWDLSRDAFVMEFSGTPPSEDKKVIAYELIKTYPHWETLGTILKSHGSPTQWTDGGTRFMKVTDLAKFPEYWQPIFETPKPVEEVITIGSANREFKISRDKIEVKRDCGGFEEVKHQPFKNVFAGTFGDIEIKSIQYRGEIYTYEDYEKIVKAFNKLKA